MNGIPNKKDHYVIGLTGAIGTGKSTIMNILRHLGAYGIDADNLVHQIFRENREIQAGLQNMFGRQVISLSGTVNRKLIAAKVFDDQKALRDLENLVHPAVTEKSRALVDGSRIPIIVIEAIKLLESDLLDMCDCVLVVDAPSAIVFDRLQSNRNMTRVGVEQRMRAQTSPEKMKSSGDYIVDNSGDIFSAWEQVHVIWEALKTDGLGFSQPLRRMNQSIGEYIQHLQTPGKALCARLVDRGGPQGIFRDFFVEIISSKYAFRKIDLQSAAIFLTDFFVFGTEKWLAACDLQSDHVAIFAHSFPPAQTLIHQNGGKLLRIVEGFAYLQNKQFMEIVISADDLAIKRILIDLGYDKGEDVKRQKETIQQYDILRKCLSLD